MICNTCEDWICNPDSIVKVVTDPSCPLDVTISGNTCDAPLYVVVCEDLTPPKPTCDEELYPNLDTCTYWVRRTCTDPVTGAIVIGPIEEDTGAPVPSTYTAILECDEVANLQTLICYEITCDGTKTEVAREVTDIPCDENCIVDIEYVCDEGADFQTAIVTAIDPTTQEVKSEVRTLTDIPCETYVRCQTRDRCNADTGFYDEIKTCYDENGDVVSEVVTPTTRRCTKDTKDTELVCSSVDGRLLALCINKDTGATELTELDGTAITDGSTGVKCTEITSIDECFQDADDDTIRYTKVTCFDKTDPDATATVVWILPDGTTSLVQPKNSVPCIESSSAITCAKDKFIEGGLDNTGTSFKHTNMKFVVEFNNCPTDEFTVVSADDWSDQVTKISAGLASIMPWAQDVDAYCQGGCGGLNAPIVILDKMFARYTGFRVCPDDCYPVSVYYTSDQNPKGRPLVLQTVESEEIYYDVCVDCEGNKSYRYAFDGETWVAGDLATPICPKPCTHIYPELPELCQPEYVGPLCDIETTFSDVDDPASDVVYNILETGIFIELACDGGINYFQEVDGGLEPYEVQGYIGDCDTLEPWTQEKVCPEECVFEEVCAEYHIAALDNNGWSNLRPFIHFGYNYTIETTLADGTVFTWSQTPVTSGGFSGQLQQREATWAALMPECDFSFRTNGVPVNGVPFPPAGVTFDIGAVYARFLMQSCCDPQKLWDNSVIIKTDAPERFAQVGATQNHEPTTVEQVVKYNVCKSCEGTYWKDENMNDLPDSEIPTCYSTCPQEVCFKDEFVSTCSDLAVNEEGQPVLTTYGNGWTSPFTSPIAGQVPVGAFNRQGTSSSGTNAIFGAPDGNYAVTSFDGQEPTPNNIGINTGILDFDLTEVSTDCEPECVTLKIAAVTVDDETGLPIASGPIDALVYSLTDGVTHFVPTTVVAGTNAPGNAIWNNVVSNGTAGATLVLDPTATVGDTGYIEAQYCNLTATQVANLKLVIGEDNDRVHVGSPALDGVTLEITYSEDADCFDKKALNTKVCGVVDVNIVGGQEEPLCVNICPTCAPDIQVDTVCNDEDQTVTTTDPDGNNTTITIGAGNPIIRKIITTYQLVNGACVATGNTTAYYDFNNPASEITSPTEPAFAGVCDSTVDTVTRCDRNGNEIQVVTISVNVSDGVQLIQTFADANGNPVPQPLLPLSICNPDVEMVKGCVYVQGERQGATLHISHDNIGRPGYDVSYYVLDGGSQEFSLAGVQWTCDCADKKICEIDQATYCYDMAAFTSCNGPTIVIDGVTTDLCDGGGVVPTSGDICVTGGVRSVSTTGNTTPPRCGRPAGTTDALNAAGLLANGGMYCPSAGGAPSTNQYNNTDIAVNGSFNLSGPATNFDVTLDYQYASAGIAFYVYDCVSGDTMPVAPSSTPATLDSACNAIIPGSTTGGFGGVNGTHTLSRDATGYNYENLVLATIVQGPEDCFGNISINGQPFGPQGCAVNSVTELVTLLNGGTNDSWTANGTEVCTTSSTNVYGDIECGGNTYTPTVTDSSINVVAPYVALDPCIEAKFDTMIDLLTKLTECMCCPDEEPNLCECETTACNAFYMDLSENVSTNTLTGWTVEIDLGECGGVSSASLGEANVVVIEGADPYKYLMNVVDAINGLSLPGFTAAPSAETYNGRHKYFELTYPTCNPWTIKIGNGNDRTEITFNGSKAGVTEYDDQGQIDGSFYAGEGVKACGAAREQVAIKTK